MLKSPFVLAAVLALGALAHAQMDPIPEAVDDLGLDPAEPPTLTTISLKWTAPVDMNGGGYLEAVEEYDLRYADDPGVLQNNWGGAARVTDGMPWLPAQSPDSDTVVVAGLSSGVTYYFAIKGSDGYNWSPISNILEALTESPPPPPPPPPPPAGEETGGGGGGGCMARSGTASGIALLMAALLLRR